MYKGTNQRCKLIERPFHTMVKDYGLNLMAHVFDEVALDPLPYVDAVQRMHCPAASGNSLRRIIMMG